jgi:hypothetical protein
MGGYVFEENWFSRLWLYICMNDVGSGSREAPQVLRGVERSGFQPPRYAWHRAACQVGRDSILYDTVVRM